MYNQFFTIKPQISEKKWRTQSCAPNRNNNKSFLEILLTAIGTQKVNSFKVSSNCSFDMRFITENSSSLKVIYIIASPLFILSETVRLLSFVHKNPEKLLISIV